MNCWHCNTELIWGSDSDLDGFSDEYDMVRLACRAQLSSLEGWDESGYAVEFLNTSPGPVAPGYFEGGGCTTLRGDWWSALLAG